MAQRQRVRPSHAKETDVASALSVKAAPNLQRPQREPLAGTYDDLRQQLVRIREDLARAERRGVQLCMESEFLIQSACLHKLDPDGDVHACLMALRRTYVNMRAEAATSSDPRATHKAWRATTRDLLTKWGCEGCLKKK